VDKVVHNGCVDFKKNLLARRPLRAVLRSYGVNDKLVTIFQKIYKEATAAVLVNAETTEWFEVTMGNRQGYSIYNIFGKNNAWSSGNDKNGGHSSWKEHIQSKIRR